LLQPRDGGARLRHAQVQQRRPRHHHSPELRDTQPERLEQHELRLDARCAGAEHERRPEDHRPQRVVAQLQPLLQPREARLDLLCESH